MITRKEIIDTINKILQENDETDFGYLIQGYSDQVNLCEDEHSGLKFRRIEQVGGEGQGDHCHLVFKVTKGEDSAFFKIDGWHNSYDGCNYDSASDIFLAQPVQKTITVYERVKE